MPRYLANGDKWIQRGSPVTEPLQGSSEELLHLLESKQEPFHKQAALLGLAYYHPHSHQLLQALMTSLNEPPLDVVALGIAGSLQCRELLPQIKQILLVNSDSFRSSLAIAAAIWAWSEMFTETDRIELHQVVERHIHHQHPSIRAAAARGLIKLGDPSGFTILEQLIESPIPEHRLTVFAHLEGLPEASVITILLKGLQSSTCIADEASKWHYRMHTMQVLLCYTLRRKDWHAITKIARGWKREAGAGLQEGFQRLVEFLRSQLERMDLFANNPGKLSRNEFQHIKRLRRLVRILESI